MVMLDPAAAMNPSDMSGTGDSMAIANAYREASDEDTRSVLNCMSNSSMNLEFYVIPVSWMNGCLPFLLGHNDERPSQKIVNAPLLEAEHPVSSSSSEEEETNSERKRRVRRQRWQERQRQHLETSSTTAALRADITHEKDFYLIGPHAWTLLSSKFGYDVALPRPCNPHASSESKLAVVVSDSLQVPVPPSGHFSYGTSEAASAPHVVAPQPDDVSVEDDMFPNYDMSSETPLPYSLGEPMSTEASTEDTRSESVLLLPPSTTTTSLENGVAQRLSPNDDDDDEMDLYDKPPAKRKRYASGLGNLGNTCFMNSMLQCLAHTDPLRRYFLSGEFRGDLNRDNPLGTGGELALQFAELLEEMWTAPRTSYGGNVAYPRNFKYALGKHAEQFMGYDQHDSQEFATYLLDALHEDTNRITNKPYVEKPEQKTNETDDEAAEVAWRSHLRREDSRVLENFMGQVKSRVQCPTQGCGRVSTTFDPFMYLSVPIPGATDRTIPVTLVPLEGKNMNFSITLSKTASISTLQQKVAEQWKEVSGKELTMNNMVAADIWHHSVYRFYEPTEDVDTIRPTDTTFVYELRTVNDILGVDTGTEKLLPKVTERRPHWKLAQAELDNVQNRWMETMEKFVRRPGLFNKVVNAKRSTHEERVEFYNKVDAFIDLCHSTSEVQKEYALLDGSMDEKESYDKIPSLSERCQASSAFQNVNNLSDLALLEESNKMFQSYILELLDKGNAKFKEGLVVQVVIHRKPLMASPRVASYTTSSSDKGFAHPLILRVPPNMTVYGLREEMACRLNSFLKTDYLTRSGPPPPPPNDPMDTNDASNVTPDESNGESDQVDMDAVPEDANSDEKPSADALSASFDLFSPKLLVMRQIPLTYERKSSYSYKHHTTLPRPLGMLETAGAGTLDSHPMTLAARDGEAEQQMMSETVGPNGTIHMNWPMELFDQAFDADEYQESEDVPPPEDPEARTAKKVLTVSDCIEKYCQMEQLDESEMWYCNKCKDHVRAWKQVHLYRAPPILIVHLKRFQYHSTTHRREKIDKYVEFPLTGLDLTNEVTHWSEDEKPIYDCYAVSNHYGGLGGGHYTAYALSDEGEWCHFDDSRVTTGVDPKEVVSSAAYVCYYRRRDVVLDGADGIITPPHPAIVPDPFFQSRKQAAYDGDVDMESNTSSNKTCPSPLNSTEGYEDANYNPELGSAMMTDENTGLPLQ